MSHIEIRVLQENDVEELVNDFNNEGVDRNKEYFQFCLDEMKNGVRVTFIACVDNHFVGTAHFLYHSNYPQFKSMDIPEINDLVVIPSWRRNSVGDKLLETLEVFAQSENYKQIGLGVGLYKDYSSAQRLYVKRGYTPDHCGVFYAYKEVEPGEMVRLDDELNLCFIKNLAG